MALATGHDVQNACRSDQLCVGAKAGTEAAVYATRDLFDVDESEGFLLVDASNAFNASTDQLHSGTVAWARCSRCLHVFNSYRGYVVIMLIHTILSCEGTTQGCPLAAMLMYAIGAMPLVSQLKDPSLHKQNWFTDDSACGGSLIQIRDWFQQLLHVGPT